MAIELFQRLILYSALPIDQAHEQIIMVRGSKGFVGIPAIHQPSVNG